MFKMDYYFICLMVVLIGGGIYAKEQTFEVDKNVPIQLDFSKKIEDVQECCLTIERSCETMFCFGLIGGLCFRPEIIELLKDKNSVSVACNLSLLALCAGIIFHYKYSKNSGRLEMLQMLQRFQKERSILLFESLDSDGVVKQTAI